MSSIHQQYRSRFGYHPCSYETFLKLRYLHKHFWITLRQFYAWYRWFRKEPRNRNGPQPAYCPVFVSDQVWIKSVTTHGVEGYRILPRTVVDHGIVDLYQTCRMPAAEPVEQLTVETLHQIDSLYHQVKEHFVE